MGKNVKHSIWHKQQSVYLSLVVLGQHLTDWDKKMIDLFFYVSFLVFAVIFKKH